MNITDVLQLGQDFLSTALLVSLPALVVSLVVGLIISVLQTITSIQEQTLSFVPRLIAVGAAMLLCLGWILRLAVHFTHQMIAHAVEFVK
jgi:flagellar biosynthetic protein FliQ